MSERLDYLWYTYILNLQKDVWHAREEVYVYILTNMYKNAKFNQLRRLDKHAWEYIGKVSLQIRINIQLIKLPLIWHRHALKLWPLSDEGLRS